MADNDWSGAPDPAGACLLASCGVDPARVVYEGPLHLEDGRVTFRELVLGPDGDAICHRFEPGPATVRRTVQVPPEILEAYEQAAGDAAQREDRERRACAWSDYRKAYGVSDNRMIRDREHAAFCAGWDAARGVSDADGPQR